MTNEEILEYQRLYKAFNETELGSLFNRFVNVHGAAWAEDERSAWRESSGKRARELFEKSDALEKELRAKLMEIVGVK